MTVAGNGGAQLVLGRDMRTYSWPDRGRKLHSFSLIDRGGCDGCGGFGQSQLASRSSNSRPRRSDDASRVHSMQIKIMADSVETMDTSAIKAMVPLRSEKVGNE